MIGNMIGMIGIYLTGLLAAGAAAQSTLQLFIDNLDPNTHWAASVIENCNGTTTYAAVCTSAAFNDACSAGAPVGTPSPSSHLLITNKNAANNHYGRTICFHGNN